MRPLITITNLDPEDKVGEYREGESRFQELLEAPFPRAAGEFAERTIDQTREAYERCSRTLDVAVQILGNSFAAAGQGAAALRRNILDTAHGQLNLSFDLAKSLAAASNPSEIVQLQAACWQKHVDAATTQAEEVRDRLCELGAPKKAEPSPEPLHPEPSKKAPSLSHETPNTRLTRATRDPERLKQRGAARDEALQQSLAAGVKFGMLDGNPVRFTSLEAWWLVDGAWRPISPDEVLLNAAVMREARFNQFFPEVPRLPSNAFKTDTLEDQ